MKVFPELPPYTIPEQDADLWECGRVGRVPLRVCPRCDTELHWRKPATAIYCCARCGNLAAAKRCHSRRE